MAFNQQACNVSLPETVSNTPVSPKVGDVDHPAVNVALRGNVDGVDSDEVRRRSIPWDSEDSEIRLADVWLAREKIVKFGEEGSNDCHDPDLTE